MKRIIKTAAYLPLAICLVLFSCKFQGKAPTSNRIEYTKEATFPNIEALDFGIYEQAKDFRMTAEEGQEFLSSVSGFAASKVAFRPNPEMKVTDEIWFYNPADPSGSASFNLKNGDFFFNSGMANFIDNKNTVGLLKNEDALKRAQAYIRELNLPVKEGELIVGHIGGVNNGILEGDKTTIFEKFTTVRFNRQLDKILVFGHSRLVFQMAQEGRIQSFIKQWAPFDKQTIKKEGLLRSPEEMRQQVEKAILEENPRVPKIRVETIRLVYYDDGSGRIEPALHIQGVTIEGEKDKIEEFPYDVVTPLLKSPRLRYTFQHSQLEKRPNKRDKSNDKQETPRSEDDLRKKE